MSQQPWSQRWSMMGGGKEFPRIAICYVHSAQTYYNTRVPLNSTLKGWVPRYNKIAQDHDLRCYFVRAIYWHTRSIWNVIYETLDTTNSPTVSHGQINNDKPQNYKGPLTSITAHDKNLINISKIHILTLIHFIQEVPFFHNRIHAEIILH